MTSSSTSMTSYSGRRGVCCVQDMLNVQTFVDFIRKRDVARIRLALREARFDINTKDEVSQYYVTSRHVILINITSE